MGCAANCAPMEMGNAMSVIDYDRLIERGRREGKGLYADFIIALEHLLAEVEILRSEQRAEVGTMTACGSTSSRAPSVPKERRNGQD